MRTVLGLTAMCFAGCAPMGIGPAVVTDVPKSREQRSVPNGSSDAEVHQDGMHASVQISQHCYVQQVDKVERTTIREHQNLAPGNDWWAGIGGAALAGAGALAVARPSAMQPEDGSTSVKEVQGAGYAMIGIGALLLTVPVIDYVRAHREAEHKVELVETAGPITVQDTRCGVPMAGAEVLGRYPDGRTLSFGRTNVRGAIEIRVDDSTPQECPFAKDDRISLLVDGTALGDLSLVELYVRREEEAWNLAAASECTTSLEENACRAQLDYARRFPT
ncbi:MAG TPA: hypothetical protein VM925_09105, partial [Labilithrix sp.]|nr:hypothetical protein [Labilithrix sp.]